MEFGIMFFSSIDQDVSDGNKYDFLIKATKFADENGFCCVWTPERHFHEFGGLFPNPSITSAALAMITNKLQLRAGSLISPLHHSIRIAEDWSVVDNLSQGRAAVSFGSGWNINDFIFFPERYLERHAVMYQQIDMIRRLWRGEQVMQQNSSGKEVPVQIYPKPLQKELPIWVTSSGHVDTFISAGAIGANILTHLIGQDIESLSQKIQKYRASRVKNNFDPDEGIVSLMLHTFLGDDSEKVRATVREPFREYLRSAISLEQMAAMGGGVISGSNKIDPHEITADVMDELLDFTFNRYFHQAALMGTPTSCQRLLGQLMEIGVDEIACLLDFIPDHEASLESLQYLNELRVLFSAEALTQSTKTFVDSFLEDL